MRLPATEPSDVALLRAAGDDPAAFAVFYRRYERLVLGWAMRRVGDPETAADLLAETFAAAWLARGSFAAGEAGAGPWLLGIAKNKVRVRARSLRIERAARDRMGIERIAVDPAHLREVEELFSDAAAWLDELPPDQREAVRAHVLDDEDYPSLAARLQIGEATARKRVSRGLSGLRRHLNHEGDAT